MAGEAGTGADAALAALVRVLAAHDVDYVLIGAHAARLHGATRPTFDVDLLPRHARDNLQRLANALNVLRPRWRVEGLPAGVKIDGGRLEPRHFPPDATAIGLTTTLGEVDIVIDTAGVAGYDAWARNARPAAVGGVTVLVAALEDIVASKEAAGRPKDLEVLDELRSLLARLERPEADETE